MRLLAAAFEGPAFEGPGQARPGQIKPGQDSRKQVTLANLLNRKLAD